MYCKSSIVCTCLLGLPWSSQSLVLNNSIFPIILILMILGAIVRVVTFVMTNKSCIIPDPDRCLLAMLVWWNHGGLRSVFQPVRSAQSEVSRQPCLGRVCWCLYIFLFICYEPYEPACFLFRSLMATDWVRVTLALCIDMGAPRILSPDHLDFAVIKAILGCVWE